MTHYRTINEMSFDRSNPDAIVCIKSDGTRVTQLEDLRDGDNWFKRTDIGMVNAQKSHCPTCTCDDDNGWVQFLVYARADGTLTGDGLAHMSAATIAECQAVADRIVEVAKVHPEFGTYLRGY